MPKLQGTLDARQQRSREAIHTAFLQLLEDKSLNEISIREIAASAGLGHATFYRHYPHKQALLNDLAADEIRRLVNLTLPIMNSRNSAAACLALCGHVNEQKKLWQTFLTGGAAGALKEELISISRHIAETSGHEWGNAALTELNIILIVSSMVETLAWWFRQPDPLPLETVAEILDGALSSFQWTTEISLKG